MVDDASNTKNTTVDNLMQLSDLAGTELGVSEWWSLSQDQINAFAQLTGDHQWIHVDVDRAKKESPYGAPIAHGFLLLSFCSAIIAQALTVRDQIAGINYGLNRVRFIQAVRVGDRFRGRVYLESFSPIERGARLVLKVVFEVEGADRPACLAENIALCYVN
ncbi:MAG: MaoC family dehydratase [Saprospiraceae bacterium]|nr:MaoC family dehydratase [Saprospiraceae bacterium]